MNKIPHITEIKEINEDFFIKVIFDTGELRIIKFPDIFEKLNINIPDAEKLIEEFDEFKMVKIDNGTLSWNNVNQFIHLKDGTRKKIPFEIGPDVLYKNSSFLSKSRIKTNKYQLMKQT